MAFFPPKGGGASPSSGRLESGSLLVFSKLPLAEEAFPETKGLELELALLSLMGGPGLREQKSILLRLVLPVLVCER